MCFCTPKKDLRKVIKALPKGSKMEANSQTAIKKRDEKKSCKDNVNSSPFINPPALKASSTSGYGPVMLIARKCDTQSIPVRTLLFINIGGTLNRSMNRLPKGDKSEGGIIIICPWGFVGDSSLGFLWFSLGVLWFSCVFPLVFL